MDSHRSAFTSISFLWVILFEMQIQLEMVIKIHYQFEPRLDEFIKSFPVGYLGKVAFYPWCGEDSLDKNGKRGSRVILCQRGRNFASFFCRFLVPLPPETIMTIKHIKNIPTFLGREKQMETIASHFIKIKQKTHQISKSEQYWYHFSPVKGSMETACLNSAGGNADHYNYFVK